jgi:hypothetical protein
MRRSGASRPARSPQGPSSRPSDGRALSSRGSVTLVCYDYTRSIAVATRASFRANATLSRMRRFLSSRSSCRSKLVLSTLSPGETPANRALLLVCNRFATPHADHCLCMRRMVAARGNGKVGPVRCTQRAIEARVGDASPGGRGSGHISCAGRLAGPHQRQPERWHRPGGRRPLQRVTAPAGNPRNALPSQVIVMTNSAAMANKKKGKCK